MPEILQWLPDWGIQVPSHSIRGHLVSASSSGLVPYHALPCPGPSSKACDIWVPAPSLDLSFLLPLSLLPPPCLQAILPHTWLTHPLNHSSSHLLQERLPLIVPSPTKTCWSPSHVPLGLPNHCASHIWCFVRWPCGILKWESYSAWRFHIPRALHKCRENE